MAKKDDKKAPWYGDKPPMIGKGAKNDPWKGDKPPMVGKKEALKRMLASKKKK